MFKSNRIHSKSKELGIGPEDVETSSTSRISGKAEYHRRHGNTPYLVGHVVLCASKTKETIKVSNLRKTFQIRGKIFRLGGEQRSEQKPNQCTYLSM